eukprot:2893854-Pyramimonas_sp.AAC.1
MDKEDRGCRMEEQGGGGRGRRKTKMDLGWRIEEDRGEGVGGQTSQVKRLSGPRPLRSNSRHKQRLHE